jgi:hypothetical protein
MATAVQTMHAEEVVSVTDFVLGPNGRTFGRSIIDSFERGVNRVVVDCRDWRRLDFGLLSGLVKAADFSRRVGATLELVNLPSTIHADIRELRLTRRLGVTS